MRDLRQHFVWKSAKRLGVDAGRRAVFSLLHRGAIPLAWCAGRNWGDALSPVLVSLLSGKHVVRAEALHHRRYLAVGSILGGANEWSEVWGSGFVREGEHVRGRPRAIYAVRGPLSRDALLAQNIECPAVYGDPALLLPCFFDPPVEPRYEIGVVAHYVDKSHPWLEEVRNDPAVLVIDVESGIERFVRDVKSCTVILSSSLHGLICADSYQIPTAWIGLSDSVIGGAFKFRDYKGSVGEHHPEMTRITAGMPVREIASRASLSPFEVDLHELLLACPFLSPSIRADIERSKRARGERPGRPVLEAGTDLQTAVFRCRE